MMFVRFGGVLTLLGIGGLIWGLRRGTQRALPRGSS
jgi:hypothetical protein